MLSPVRSGSSPRQVTLPELASTGDFIFMFPCFGSFTGDSHPIYNAPMLGAHNAIQIAPAPAGLLACLLLIPLRGQEPGQKQAGASDRGRSEKI